jgi:two-component system response regulator
LNPIERPAIEGTEILLIEDCPGDIELFKVMFQHEYPSYHLTVATDGIVALGQLFDESNVYRPNAIVLDSDLPKLHSSEVLAAIKADERTKTIPVFFKGSEYDTKKWKGPKPDHYGGRMIDVNSYFDFVRKIDSILNRR